jgi:hypothetical protein
MKAETAMEELAATIHAYLKVIEKAPQAVTEALSG